MTIQTSVEYGRRPPFARGTVVSAGLSGETAARADDAVRSKPPITIIEPVDRHRDQLRSALGDLYDVTSFRTGREAVRALPLFAVPAVMIVDERTPPRGGAAAIEAIGSDPVLRHVPLIGMASHESSVFVRLLRGRGCPVLIKPFTRARLYETLSALLTRELEAQWDALDPAPQGALKKTVAIFNEIPNLILEGKPIPYSDVRDSCASLVEAVNHGSFDVLLNSVKGHDNYTYVHSIRVATFLAYFGHELGLVGDDLLTVAAGGLLHDIGKVAIPRALLNKPGRLSEAEWTRMRGHVTRTVEMLDRMDDVPRGVVTIAGQHHEKLDGTGYPRGLKGGALNDLARMAAIVDVFGALTDRRSYKDPMSPEAALDLMEGMRGHLDPHLVRLFRETLRGAASILAPV
ncbi:HD domain-containing phosphohydrolase [Roseospira visakhapatnamensis]|uniref:Putative nucleotidyltransferase with HDIG domain n=1 Tax=Roseospira visakhapatnamensis TaxID=390880 RepID=A0A7W6RC91_9PROT|nr:HD domain-containing phosphohydrolase [Roseospira visakhapatnamensis]MBB4265763.1 putative nucleotidyltransferase with HDIG domain [Roseospira visakhapatnamensis]